MSFFPSTFTRRKFALTLGAAGLANSRSFAFATSISNGEPSVPKGDPPQKTAFTPLALGSIKPLGWLKSQLHTQADGLSGHLDETWPDVGGNSGWLGGTGESWERGPYYLDGLLPLAYLLEDDKLKAKAQRFIDWTLKSQKPNGMFGPGSNDDWWPRMVMVKVLAQYQEATSDPRVIPMMTRYFEYQLKALQERPLTSWGKYRWQDQALIVLWLHDRTGNPKLLELMRLLHSQGYDWVAQFDRFVYHDTVSKAEIAESAKNPGTHDVRMETHGVNNGEAVKTGAVWSRISGVPADRGAVLKMITELEKHHGLPNGMFSCDEHFAGPNPSQGSELCAVVEYMYSLEQSLAILGDPSLADRLEKLAFNALPGTMTDDMWAHQYDQQPNQVECSLHKEPWSTNGVESNLFGLEPNFGCCTANFSQGWPKFAASLFMASADDGVVAVAYSPCSAHFKIKGADITIVEETEYPFRSSIRMTVNVSRPTAFPFLLRIPGWTADAEIRVNGEPQNGLHAGAFARIERKWSQGDTVELNFPMEPRVIGGFNDSVSIERGPLVFSYGIDTTWLKLRERGMTADWQLYPASRWNYALGVSPLSSKSKITVVERPVTGHPFALTGAPVQLRVKAKLLPTWMAVEGVAQTVPRGPVTSGEAEETITLVPYAAAKLRITSFPCLEGA